jgi:biotin carboxyl carrier protein
MAYEIKLGDRIARIELLNRVDNKMIVAVDDQKYELDLVMVEKGVYSIIYNGHSYNIELIEGEGKKDYIVNTFARSFDVEIIDAESKYLHSRNQGSDMEGDLNISSPMPGKIIKVPVSIGESVTAGQTLIVVEAMKMQSEFKATGDRVVREILVKEGDTVSSHQLMIRLE